jgi:hypothetical protein
MKRFFAAVLPFCGVLAMAFTASAQDWRRDTSSGYGDRYTDNRYGAYRQSPIDRVMLDLNRAFDRARLDGRERKHFEDAARNLQEFQSRWSRGKFDTGRLDRAISSIERLSQADRVRGPERMMLARDLNELRQFRASRNRYNYDPRYPR